MPSEENGARDEYHRLLFLYHRLLSHRLSHESPVPALGAAELHRWASEGVPGSPGDLQEQRWDVQMDGM